ncbi:MAG: isoprenylcysteine carboxyl methyltransferase family protein [Caulobacteraceae bacterium]
MHLAATLAFLAFVSFQRACELLLAWRNTKRLRAKGAYEVGSSHYPFIVVLHGAWLAGLWLLGWDRALSPVWVGAYVALQAARFWILASLGGRWTTRILILPGAPLVKKGPYRYLRHPNYLIVAGEIAVAPMALGLDLFAVIFTALNGVAVAVRIKIEDRALREPGI